MRNGWLMILALLSAHIHAADDKQYISGAMQVGFYEQTSLSRMEPTSLQLKYGYEFAERGAVEFHYLFGIDPGTLRKGTVTSELDIDSGTSLFLRGNLPISESARFYGLIGYSDIETTLEVSNTLETEEITDSDAGVSYGFGFEHRKPRSNLSINFEYILYLNETDYDFTGFNLGLSHHF